MAREMRETAPLAILISLVHGDNTTDLLRYIKGSYFMSQADVISSSFFFFPVCGDRRDKFTFYPQTSRKKGRLRNGRVNCRPVLNVTGRQTGPGQGPREGGTAFRWDVVAFSRHLPFILGLQRVTRDGVDFRWFQKCYCYSTLWKGMRWKCVQISFIFCGLMSSLSVPKCQNNLEIFTLGPRMWSSNEDTCRLQQPMPQNRSLTLTMGSSEQYSLC